MLNLLRFTVAVVSAVGVAVWLGWAEPYSLKLGAIPAVIFAALAGVAMVATRTVSNPNIRSSASPLREIFLGAATASAWLAAMGFTYWMFGEVPYFPQAICDHSRPYIEQEIRELEDRGQFSAAAAVGQKELDAVHTPEWTKALAEWTVRLLCRAAAEASAEDAGAFIEEALAIAERYDVADDLPRLAKERLYARFKTDEAQQERDDIKAQLKRAAAEKQHTDANHKRELAATVAERRAVLASALAYLSRGIEQGLAGNLDKLRTTLQQALTLAIKERLPADEARAVLARLEARIAALRPADLSAGATGRVLRQQSGGMPRLQLVDVEVRHADGQPLTGLADKDFVAQQQGATLRVAACARRQATRVNVAIAIDTSSSTQGEPSRQAQAGATSLLTTLPSGTFVRLTAFSDRVRLLADWSPNPAAAIAACHQLRADGATALFVAAEDVATSLASVPGERHGVIFSDGASSLPGPTQEAIVAAARRQGVTLHFIALKESDHDTQAIELIARDTGGRTLLVQRASDLVAGFRSLATSLAEDSYRIALLDYDADKPLSIEIGSAHAVHLTIPPAAEAASVAAH
jgi:hypothetical protein